LPHVDLAKLYTNTLGLYRSGGLPRGESTGWAGLDEYYTVGQGQITVVTGIPGSGKSEFTDALAVNLAERGDWFFAMYSPENFPVEGHLAKIVEKRARLPFNEGPTQRMSEAQYTAAAQWALEHFVWLETDLATPDHLLELSTRYNARRKLGVILDPWNTLDHERDGMSETDYISKVLTGVTHFVRSTNAHVWLVVHPKKIERNKDGSRPVPTPYDLAGSAHWYNKADNIITVHRDQAEGSQIVQIHTQKVRFKHMGHVGLMELRYDKVTGRYFEGPRVNIPGENYADPERGCEPPLFDREAEEERASIEI
jgi:twinkle protein